MIHRQERRAHLRTGKGRERNQRAALRLHVNMVKRLGSSGYPWVGLQHHAVLVELGEGGGHLSLPKSIVKRAIDVAHRQSESRQRVAVDGDLELEPVGLLVGGDVA